MRSAVYLLLLLAGLTLFVGLDHPAITDSDEAFYAEAGREMLAGGDWLTPHFNYENRFQKPILFYWIVAACYTVAGVGEAPARLGSAAAGLGIVLLALACGRRWFDEATGVLAAAIVATSLGCTTAARLSLPDLPLAFFITLAVWAGFGAMLERGRRPRRRWLLAAAAVALGVLTKGPVAAVIPALVLAPSLVFERGWRRVRASDLALAALVFVAIAAPWYIAMARVHGTEYLRGFFVGDNLERFATTAFNAHRPPYFYVPIVLGGMLPWSPFFALGVRPLWRLLQRRQWPARADLRVIVWAAVPLLLFTISVGKQPRYILPTLAPLALLLAVGMRRAITAPLDLRPARPGQRRGTLPPLPGAQPGLFRLMAALSGVIVVVCGGLLWRARPLLVAMPPARVAIGSLVLAAAGLVVVAIAASRAWRRSPVAIAAAGALLVVVLGFAVLAPPDLDPVQQMAARVLAHRRGGEPVGSYRVFVRNMVFYTHVQQAVLYSDQSLAAFLDNPDPVLCVLTEPDLRRLQVGRSVPLRRLESMTYFDAATARIGTVLWPNPERDLQTAVLVSNK